MDYLNTSLCILFDSFLGGRRFEFSFEDFIGDSSYLSRLGSVISILGALLLPPFLSIYGLVLSSTHNLYREVIKDKYSFYYILRLILYFIFFITSNSSVFCFLIMLALVIEVLLVYTDYIKLSFFGRDLILDNIGRDLKKSSEEFKKFEESVGKASELVKLNEESSLRNQIDSVGYYKYFQSKNKVNGVNQAKFSQLLKDLNSIVKIVQHEGDLTLTESLNDPTQRFIKEASQGINSIRLSTDEFERSLILDIEFSSDVKFEDLEEELDKLRKRFSSSFEYSFERYKLKDGVRHYFENLHLLLAELAAGERYRDFKQEVDLVRTIINSENSYELRHSYGLLLRGVESLQEEEYSKHLNDEQRGEIYLLWMDIFRSLSISTMAQDVEDATRILIKGIKRNFWNDTTSFNLDRHITILLDYEKVSIDFVSYFLSSLMRVIATSDSLSDNHIRRSVEFIKFVLEDSSPISNCGRMVEKKNDENIEKVFILVSECVFVLSAYGEYKNRKDIKDVFFPLVVKENFLSILYIIYNDNKSSTEIMRWEPHVFNRVGIGQTRSFDSFSFLRKFLISYFDLIGVTFLSTQKLNPDLIYFFEKVIEEYKSSDKEILKEILSSSIEIKERSIIDSELCITTIEEFFTGCLDSFSMTRRISELFCKNYLSDKESGSFGLNTFLNREYFLKCRRTNVSGLYEYGAVMARGENDKILKEIKARFGCKNIEIKIFFNETIYEFFGKNYVLVTNNYQLRNHVSMYNDKLKVVYGESGSPSFLKNLINDTVIELLIINFDKERSVDYCIFLKKEKFIQINYTPVQYGEGEINKTFEKELYMEIEDLATSPDIVEGLIGRDLFDDDQLLSREEKKHRLLLKLGLKLTMRISLSLNMKESYQVKTFKLMHE